MNVSVGFLMAFFAISLLSGHCLADDGATSAYIRNDTIRTPAPKSGYKDLADVLKKWFPRLPISTHDSSTLKDGKRFVLVIPQIGYTLQTRGLVALMVNAAFRNPRANMSSMTGTIQYTQNRQLISIINSLIWSADNRFLWSSDWRLMQYPQPTYGLGMHTSTDQAINMDYTYLRLYQNFYRRLATNLYAGLGYSLDLHWNIRSYTDQQEISSISGYTTGVTGRSISSGPTLNLLYDSRRNAINPIRGFYINATFRANTTLLGSDQTYQAFYLDARKYIPFPAHSNNVLAFWSYNTFTVGTPPFLDLPSTGWDYTGNSGRGFIQGRFRGRDFVYVETEYRFHITNNRLLGGVVFTNAQTVTEPVNRQFQKVVPGAGLGLRLKLNKISRTNFSVDYGFGLDGSRGFFFNLGEVF